jgi:hypothetical protein
VVPAMGQERAANRSIHVDSLRPRRRAGGEGFDPMTPAGARLPANRVTPRGATRIFVVTNPASVALVG